MNNASEMQRTRKDILKILKKRGSTRLDELAKDLGLVPVTVRSHLSILERDNLVVSQEVRGRMGRPYFVYSLTEEAYDFFPQRYDWLANNLLDALVALEGEGQVSRVFHHMVDLRVGQYAGLMEGKDLPEKVAGLVNIFREEAGIAEWGVEDGRYVLREYNCPLRQVAKNHSHVCWFDMQFVRRLLKAEVQRETCMVDGDECCTYVITPE